MSEVTKDNLYPEGYHESFENITKGLADDDTITIRVDDLREGIASVKAATVLS